jgi:hypothetical protein
MTVGSNEGCMRVPGSELHVCMLIYWFCALLELFYSYEYLGRTQTEVTSLLMPCTFHQCTVHFHFYSPLPTTKCNKLHPAHDNKDDDNKDGDDDDDDGGGGGGGGDNKSATKVEIVCSTL